MTSHKKPARKSKSSFRTIAWIVFGSLFFVLSVFVVLVIVAVHVGKDLPEKMEEKLAQSLESEFPEAENVNPPVKEHLTGLMARLANAHGAAPATFSLVIKCTPDVNALALPGGKIVIFSGLLPKLRNESELALLLGHEMAHVFE